MTIGDIGAIVAIASLVTLTCSLPMWFAWFWGTGRETPRLVRWLTAALLGGFLVGTIAAWSTSTTIELRIKTYITPADQVSGVRLRINKEPQQ